MTETGANQHIPLGERERDLLRWRCRRGLVENDLFIERFFNTHGPSLTQWHAAGLSALMELADNDLMDLFLRRTQPQGPLDIPEVHEVLRMIVVRPFDRAVT